MTKIDPIIAVSDVEASVAWYEKVFGFRRAHGEKGVFAVLVTGEDEVILCLHKWGEHHHPTMMHNDIQPGNGLILYFRTENMNETRKNVEKTGHDVEEEVHLNQNSLKNEFCMRDPDGYYLVITEFHKYGEQISTG